MEILNEFVTLIKTGDYTWGLGMVAIPCFGCALGLGLIAYMCLWDASTFWEYFGGIIASILCVFAIIMAFYTKPATKEVTRYEVIINQDAGFYDIVDNYDIIERRGDIFVLQEKDG